ncbi:hypothetical protein QVD17_10934 [Tagetes erecta]|uniref:Uncharacterized protein n=1 Tax=Tagetes erecta TaxID=13708 RepID=A0AAD8L7I1_TARER|nr:hypothetical protein QVD17_10934 [Tagetes erecta]
MAENISLQSGRRTTEQAEEHRHEHFFLLSVPLDFILNFLMMRLRGTSGKRSVGILMLLLGQILRSLRRFKLNVTRLFAG